MIKKWLLLCISLMPAIGWAQLRYKTDTMYYNNSPVTIRRSTPGQIDSFQRLSPKAFQLGLNIQKLQKQLDAGRNAIINKWELYEYTINEAQDIIDKSLAYDPRFTMDVYQEELNIYKIYKQKQDLLQENK